MTPAIQHLKSSKIDYQLHTYNHDPKCDSYGMEAAEKIGVDPKRVFKTLVLDVGGELAVAILPVSEKVSVKLFARACGGKKAVMADKNRVQKVTGYVLGGVSPVGQKKRLQTVLDTSALDCETIFVSGGKRGCDIELAPGDLLQLVNGKSAEIVHTS